MAAAWHELEQAVTPLELLFLLVVFDYKKKLYESPTVGWAYITVMLRNVHPALPRHLYAINERRRALGSNRVRLTSPGEGLHVGAC